ncbi:hypothetical protein DICSQDRAFT_72752 [Dichomitus squalens LYAD-421 SS1]|uniref:Uncharacterized protein n=1 Tax=Dichomitus squalens (strain LYAD-421) TaxID=732165 RepID=R7SJD8_DICSQ|nr:uncharacterized protein DICSQDRAFT_72752 [Dichomitus squalens LYAD-421 SS1]EJF55835.1 hypothetical protein DICSQDRAFT_72752 [Dichomitus squalens LYAD-421 SS1]
MTDFASQGRIHINNMVNLHGAKNHQSVYTAFSRGVSLQGAIILQGFDDKHLTGEITGDLRQEFRELKLLDEITCLRYEGKCSTGITRSELIHSFRIWKDENYVTKTMHKI